MTDDVRERVARAIYPDAWGATLPIPTRADIVEWHKRRQASIAVGDRAIAALRPGDRIGDCVLVPVEPTPGLLISMALRLQHDFGLLPEAERRALMDGMRKLHEEVVGTGYYDPTSEHRYCEMLPEA